MLLKISILSLVVSSFWSQECAVYVLTGDEPNASRVFLCYIDDVIIFSITPQEHVWYLQAVIERLPKWGLCLHHAKCKFFHDRLPYLGHMIEPRGLGVQQTKVDAL